MWILVSLSLTNLRGKYMARYGKPLHKLHDVIHKAFGGHPTAQQKLAVIRNYSDMLFRDVKDKANICEMYRSMVTLDLIGNKAIRLYIQDQKLVDFLLSTSSPTTEAAKVAMDQFSANYAQVIHLLTPDKQVRSYLLDVDIKDETRGLLLVHVDNTIAQFDVTPSQEWLGKSFDEQIHEFGKQDNPQAYAALQAAILVINLIYYINTFPDALVDGIPSERVGIAQPPKGNYSKVLKIHPDILEPQAPGSRVTHFRHGHYRYLSSDFYKNKKNTWVFVHGSIVKGSQAKTVI